jgi:putative DNA primase/helicase
MLGAKAGAWYDHEAGQGGGPLELITRQRGGDWRTSADWARRWLGEDITTARDPAAFDRKPANDPGFEHGDQSRRLAAQRARRDWLQAEPARADHQYLARKQVLPHDLRQDRGGRLVIALVDLNGATQTLQTIDATGEKRFLSGGAKSGHFATIGGTLPEGGTILIAEGWATAATAFEATGYPAVAAMDAGNLAPVAIRLRDRYPAARLTILADNDQRDGRPDNPGIAAATAAARAVGALLALPPMPGDMNDMALAFGPKFVQSLIDAAQPPPTVKPTYPRPVLTPIGARLMLQRSVRQFAEDTACYWRETSSLDRHDSG